MKFLNIVAAVTFTVFAGFLLMWGFRIAEAQPSVGAGSGVSYSSGSGGIVSPPNAGP